MASRIFSGAENVVCQIIAMNAEYADYELSYCSPEGPELREALANRNIRYLPLKRLSVSAIRKIIKDEKPDIIHAHDMKASFLTSIVCEKIPLICHIHNNAFDSRRISIKSVLFLYAGLKAKWIFWVSETSLNGYRYIDYLRNKSEVLENVVDLDEVRRKADESELKIIYDVVFLGRLVYEKNPQMFVNIIKELKDRGLNIRAALLGAGELEQELRNIIRDSILEDQIDLLGFVRNPYGYIKNAKCMLMTSRWEGLPMSALEAMALGTPIVSTPVGGMKSLIENGKVGFLAEDKDKLADAVQVVLTDDDMRNAMSKHVIERSEQLNDRAFYFEHIRRAYTYVYEASGGAGQTR